MKTVHILCGHIPENLGCDGVSSRIQENNAIITICSVSVSYFWFHMLLQCKCTDETIQYSE